MSNTKSYTLSLVLIISILFFSNAISSQKPIGIYEAAIELYALPAAERFDPQNEATQRICKNIGLTASDVFTTGPASFYFSGVKETSSSGQTIAKAASVGKKFASLPVTNLADGVSVFLVNRAKQELSVAFFSRLTNGLETLPLIQENFPFTVLQLNEIDSKIYRFEQYIQSLRQSFTADLKGLPGNFGGYLMSHPELIKAGSTRALAGDGLHTMQRFILGHDVSNIVHYLSTDSSYIQSFNGQELEVLKGVFKTTDLILHAFQNQDDSWVDFNSFNQMIQNQGQLNVFLGLLLAKAEEMNIDFGGAFKFQQLVKDVDHFKKTLSGMLFQVNQLVSYAKILENAASEKSFEDYFNVMSSIFSILESGYEVIPSGLVKNEQQVKSFFDITRGLSSMSLFVYQKRYSSAITEMSIVLEGLNLKTKTKKGNTTKTWKKALKYANFFALIAEAESGTEVARVIEQFAAPVGSSSEKRKNIFTAGINGYLGGNYGRELATGEVLKNSVLEKESYYALSAPVGVSLNLGLKDISVGAFISLIDVGAISAYRFDDENTEELPEVTWGNILAPGINFELGFSNLPLTIGIGQQWGPNLRKVTSTELGLDEITVTRQSIYVRVDIPIAWF